MSWGTWKSPGQREVRYPVLSLLDGERGLPMNSMKLSKKYLLLLPAASFLLAAAVGSGACSTTASVGLVVGMAPADDTFPDGVVLGDKCSGDVYVTGGTGYAFCDNDVWS